MLTCLSKHGRMPGFYQSIIFPAPSGAGSPAAAAPRRHQLPRSFPEFRLRASARWGFSRSYRNARQGNPPAVPSSPCQKTDNSRQDSPPRRSASALWWKNRRIVFTSFFEKKVVEIFVVAHVHQMPVIQPCPLDRLVGNVKAQRTNQMQYAPGRRAGSCDVAGVRRNLRLHQNHMQHKTTPLHENQLLIFYDRTSEISTGKRIFVKNFCEKISILRGYVFVHLREFSNQPAKNHTKPEMR